jgi:methionine sulfoxide reductase heme-binding subunit
VAVVTNPAVWYFMRGSGIVSLLLLTLVLVRGIASFRRSRLGELSTSVTRGLHRNASLLAVLFLSVHVGLAIADPDASVGLVATFVPFAGSHSPFWVGLGSIALDLLLLIVVTSLLRRHLTQRAWRRIHFSSYAAWPFAWLHGVGMGTDNRTGWMLAVELICLAAVGGAVAWRALDGRTAARGVTELS